MSKPNRPFSFLQMSDVFLDASLTSKSLGMTVRQRHERNQEALESVLDLCQAASRLGAGALVVSGNLWDGRTVTIATISRLREAFAALQDMPVIIAPGTSDPLSTQSFHHSKVLSMHASRGWSNNVHIFSTADYSCFVCPGRDDVHFFGRAVCTTGGASTDSSSATDLAGTLDESVIKIVVGAAPLSQAMSNGDAFHYAALSGPENLTTCVRSDGRIISGSSGTLIARSLEQSGRRNALLVTVERSNKERRQCDVTIKPLLSDRRRIVPVAVSINGIKPHNLPDCIEKASSANKAEKHLDIIHLKLTGRYPAGSKTDFGISQLLRHYYHVIVDDETRPDFMLDHTDPRSTEGRFIQLLHAVTKKTEAKLTTDAGKDEDEIDCSGEVTSAIIEDAIRYGLEALRQQKVSVPDVD
jgi:hypothetical protein